MLIGITGNRDKDLCKALVERLESKGNETICFSRSTGYDFGDQGTIKRVIQDADSCDVFVNMYANFFFRQTMLAHELWHDWNEKNYSEKLIINIGSTTDTVRRGKTNRYHHEKLALKEMSNALSIVGVWGNGPKVSHVSFGTLFNKQDKHPNRSTMGLDLAAHYIEWLLFQPKDVNINTISIDPIQRSEASSLSNNSAAIIKGENNG